MGRGVLGVTGGMLGGQEALCLSNAAGEAPRTRTQNGPLDLAAQEVLVTVTAGGGVT